MVNSFKTNLRTSLESFFTTYLALFLLFFSQNFLKYSRKLSIVLILTFYVNAAMAKGDINTKFYDADNFAFQLLSDANPHNYKTRSSEFHGGALGFSSDYLDENGNHKSSVSGSSQFYANTVSEKTLFNIASITKPFTAALTLKLTENEEYKEKFPQGINTPISYFLSSLKVKYPNNQYIQNQLEKESYFHEITLRNLLQQTAGLGKVENLGEQLEKSQKLSKPFLQGELLEFKRSKGQFGDFEYSDLNYELLTLILEAITDKTYSQLLQENIAQPLGISLYSSDKMEFKDGKMAVQNHPEIDVAQGYYYQATKPPSQPAQFSSYQTIDYGSGGIYTTAKYLNIFFKNYIDGNLFEATTTKKLLKESGIATNEKDSEEYGFGFRKIQYGKQTYFYHGGADLGFDSFVVAVVEPEKTTKVASTMVNWENLTPKIASCKTGIELDNKDPQHQQTLKSEMENFRNKPLNELLELCDKLEINKRVESRQNKANISHTKRLQKQQTTQPNR